ncbi:hypothetical protein ET464_16455 [Paenibacillus protaetiae]|uniref:Uncharacterized protein n=1 Tax=Paenibacillus protaetiae TaxID=2509456 RepID=A0A4P6EWI8_9BACL|nr:hypothetical protein ET464_16455 [Paenibacillus protaetiae]
MNKKVYLNGNSYVQLTDASLVPSTNGAVASFTFTMYNAGSTSINVIDYWARLKTKSGTKYTLTLLDKDKLKTVSPNSSATLVFYSEVPASVTLDKLVLDFIKFDFSVSGYEKTIGEFTFPAEYSNSIPAGGFKTVKINSSNVNLRVDQINVYKATDKYNINLSYVARNTSQFGVPLPEYNYYVQTSVGLYKLAVKNTSDANTTLEPSVLNSIRLTGSVPTSVPASNWKLIITQKLSGDSSVELPVGTFAIPFTVNSNSITTKSTFTDEVGTYDVELQSVQRFPWNDEDNVVAKVLVKNTESVYLPLPSLTGTLIIDENISLDSQVISNTGDVGLAPGASTTMTFVGKLPYSYNWKKLKLQLMEKSGETTAQVAEIAKNDVTPIYSVPNGSVYKQLSNGSQMSVQATDVRTYSGDTDDLFAAYLDITNNQTRSAYLPYWVAYFKADNGNLYPATVVKSPNAISPSNKDQVIAYANIPQTVNHNTLQLLIGEAFDNNGLLKKEGTPAGYIRAVTLGLPAEKTDTTQYKDLKVGPYNVDLNYFNVYIGDTGTLEIDLGGNVARDYSYDAFSQSKLLFELEYEPSGDVLWSQQVNLESKSDNAIQWKVGDNYNSISKDLAQTKFWSRYTLHVYDTLNGNKKLLFSKDVKFSSITNWLDGQH